MRLTYFVRVIRIDCTVCYHASSKLTTV